LFIYLRDEIQRNGQLQSQHYCKENIVTKWATARN